jgi:protein TonB
MKYFLWNILVANISHKTASSFQINLSHSKQIIMKAESILKADILDIIFQNKNKDYGAYQLRKLYPSRLKKSIVITMLLVFIFAGLQGWRIPKKVVTLEIGEVITLDKFSQPIKEMPKEKPKELQTQAIKKAIAEVPFNAPVITPDHLVKNVIPENIQVDTSYIGTKFNPNGGQDSGFVGVKSGDPKDIPFVKGNTDVVETIDEEPTFTPSVMPEFPGGVEALKRFMLNNLRQPDDINEGEKFVVLVQFVVDKNGSISDVQILQNGREDLDTEVMRVINRMPKWKAGSQSGNAVAVYYKMPISFINNN